MQMKKKQVKLTAITPDGTSIGIPPHYWSELAQSDIKDLCRRAGVGVHQRYNTIICMPMFHTQVEIDLARQTVICQDSKLQQTLDIGLLELIVLVYLLNATEVSIGGRPIGVQELKSAHFFQGPHTLMTEPLIERFGNHPERLLATGKGLGAEVLGLADAAIKVWPLPRIPLSYLLWAGDEEFDAQLSFMFDPTIEQHFAADGIWGLVNMTSQCLLADP
jgi:hypothetical protein